jgi:hypothetical protein
MKKIIETDGLDYLGNKLGIAFTFCINDIYRGGKISIFPSQRFLAKIFF